MSAIDLERARILNDALMSLALESSGIGTCPLDKLTLLREASLAELIAAGPAVKADDEGRPPAEDGSRTFSVVCDDRLVAAIYAFLHYALPPASSPHEPDFPIVHVTDTTHTYFLVSGARERAVEREDEDAAA